MTEPIPTHSAPPRKRRRLLRGLFGCHQREAKGNATGNSLLKVQSRSPQFILGYGSPKAD